MKRYLVILTLLLFTGVINAQWQQVTNWPENGAYSLEDVFFVDSSYGWAVGNGHPSIYHTTDGGNTWFAQSEPGTEYVRYHEVKFFNRQIGYIAGGPISGSSKAIILKTVNGGTSWNILNHPAESSGSQAVCLLDSLNIWLAGATRDLYYYNDTTGTNSGLVWRSTDGGETWSVQKIGKPPYGFREIKVLADGTGWLAGYNGFYTTSDFGTTWEKANISLLPNERIVNFRFIDNKTGYLFIDIDWQRKSKVLKTIDGGRTWSKINDLNYGISVANSLSLNGLDLFLLGINTGQYVLKSTDGGISWNQEKKLIESGTTYQGIFALGNNAWVVGPQIWRYSKPVLPPMFISVSYPRTLYWPVEFKVTMEINDFDDHQLSAVKLIDSPDSLRVYGSYPNYEIRGSVPESLVGQSFQFCVLAIGFSGDSTIYLSDSIKVDRLTKVETLSGVPVDYDLSQNYPNPFNPSTKIRYSIPKGGNVNLTIYNILGQAVTTLVNEYQSVGNYEYTFTADNLASGTYIYRLVAGNYVSTKKMVYVK